MPIKRNLDDVIKLWLRRLNEAKDHSSSSISSSNNQIQLVELFKKVENEFRDMKEAISEVERWEELVHKEFDAIEEHVAAAIFNNGEEPTKIEEALQIMSSRIGQYKKLTSLVKSGSLTVSTENLPQPKHSSKASKISKVWQQLGIEENIFRSDLVMANLQVSYDILDTQLKLCLLCFSIFPENAIIKKRPLIYWWTGEGLVTESKANVEKNGDIENYGDVEKNGDVKKNGDEVFAELIEKGMIKAVHKKANTGVGSCQVHPWIRLMLIAVAKKDGFFDFDAAGRPIANCSVSRRSCLMSPDRSPIKDASSSKEEEHPINLNVNVQQNAMHQKASDSSSQRISNAQGLRGEKLRTLFNVNENYLKLKAEMFSKENKVDVVQLGRWQDSNDHHIEVESIEFLKGLGAKRYLRYLSLRGISRITKLPASVSKLLNLEILDLRACHNLEELPSGIIALKKLMHLDVSECYLLEYMPKGFERLSSLHVLKGFVVGNTRVKDASRFQDLGKLKNLCKLSIYIASDAVVTDQELGELQRLEALHVLKITWAGEYLSTASNTEQREMEETVNPDIVSEENASLEMVEAMDHINPIPEDNVPKTDEIGPLVSEEGAVRDQERFTKVVVNGKPQLKRKRKKNMNELKTTEVIDIEPEAENKRAEVSHGIETVHSPSVFDLQVAPFQVDDALEPQIVVEMGAESVVPIEKVQGIEEIQEECVRELVIPTTVLVRGIEEQEQEIGDEKHNTEVVASTTQEVPHNTMIDEPDPPDIVLSHALHPTNSGLGSSLDDRLVVSGNEELVPESQEQLVKEAQLIQGLLDGISLKNKHDSGRDLNDRKLVAKISKKKAALLPPGFLKERLKAMSAIDDP